MTTKVLSFFSLLIIIALPVFSQAYDYPERQTEALEFVPGGYLGLSTGINNFNGMLGINGEIKIIRNLTIAGGAGIGGWGYKFAGAVRYYLHYPKGFCFGLGYSTATGMQGFEAELETTRPGGSQMVELNLNRANNLNLTASYQWRLGKRFRLGLDLGYAFPLQDKAWELVSDDIVLSDTSEQVMDILTPGGLILGFGFSIGL
jgi:hypothetical protein